LVEDMGRIGRQIEEARRVDPMPDPEALTLGELIDLLTVLEQSQPLMAEDPVIRDQVIRREMVLLSNPGFKAFLDWKAAARLQRLSPAMAARELLTRLGEQTGKADRELRLLPILSAEQLLEPGEAPSTKVPVPPSIEGLKARGFKRFTVAHMNKQWLIGVDTLQKMADRAVSEDQIHADYEILSSGKQPQLWARLKP
jgi:hypothetical protein